MIAEIRLDSVRGGSSGSGSGDSSGGSGSSGGTGRGIAAMHTAVSCSQHTFSKVVLLVCNGNLRLLSTMTLWGETA